MSPNSKIVLKGSLSKVESRDEALKCVKQAEQTIEKFKPKKPTWLKSFNSNAPLQTDSTSFYISLLAVASLVGGGLLGLLLSIGTFSIFDSLLLQLSPIIITPLVAMTILTPLLFGDMYGGSKTRQPIRKLFAKIAHNKKEREVLELRVEEYEAYSEAQEIHQALIENTRNNLIHRGVFDILNTKTDQHLLDEKGVHKVVKGEVYLTESYNELSNNMVKHLSEYLEIEK